MNYFAVQGGAFPVISQPTDHHQQLLYAVAAYNMNFVIF
mgnify:CR=1 FL=1|jgi:hypothetical protein